MTHSKRITALTALALTCSIYAAGLTGLPAAAGTLETKDADAVVELHERTITLDAEGRITDETLIRKKLITYDSMDTEGDPHLTFNDRFQELDIRTSKTITPEGKIVHTQDNGFNLITPFALRRAPSFTDGKQMVVSHMGLDLGAVTELRYMISDKEKMRPYLSGEELLAVHHPMEEMVVRVTVPAGTDLKYAALNGDVEYSSSRDASSTTHSFRVSGVPLVRTRYAIESERTYLPRLVYTTAVSWEEAAAEFFGRCSKAGVADERLTSKAVQLTGEERSDYRKLHILHGYVHDSIREVHWPLADLPGTPRSAAEVYASRYGLPLEKAILLRILLEEVGIESELVMMGNGPTVAKEVPSMAQFPIPLVEVTIEGRTILVNPETSLDRDASWDFAGNAALRFSDGQPEHFQVKLPVNSTTKLTSKACVTLNDDFSGSGEVTIELSGVYSPHTTCLLTGEKTKEFVENLVSKMFEGCVSDSVETVELSSERSVFLSFVSIEAPDDNTPLALTLGNAEKSLAGSIEGLHLQSRDLPVLLGWPGEEVLEIEITLPESEIRVVLPPEAKLHSRELHARRTVSRTENRINIRRSLEIGDRLIEPESYPALRQAMGIVKDPNSNTVFLTQ